MMNVGCSLQGTADLQSTVTKAQIGVEVSLRKYAVRMIYAN